ncbi:DNA-damage-inducible protein J [Clostridia bacterium]|nr:DNA-damage-inducible protein J [Clostridia bacterium]
MAQISFRIDDALKLESEQVFRSLGMNMTTAFNIFLRQAVKEKGIPFPISAKENNNIDYLKKIETSKKQANSGNVVSFTIDELTRLETMSADDAYEFMKQRKSESQT